MSMLEYLPDDWIILLGQEWLTPREQRRLATISKRFYALLPQPLRIQICSSSSNSNSNSNSNKKLFSTNDDDDGCCCCCCCLGGDLFVSRVRVVGTKNTTLSSSSLSATGGRDENTSSIPAFGDDHFDKPWLVPSAAPLTVDSATTTTTTPATTTDSSFQYYTEYCFWKFDYEAQCRVYLGKQLRQTHSITTSRLEAPPPGAANINTTAISSRSKTQYRYTLGFRPHSPNQYWKLIPVLAATAAGNNDEAMDSTEDHPFKRHQPRAVRPGEPILFLVAGLDPREGQVDSVQEHQLYTKVRMTHNGGPIWTWYTAARTTSADAAEATTTTTTSGISHDKKDHHPFVLFPSSSLSSYPRSSGGLDLASSLSCKEASSNNSTAPSTMLIQPQRSELETFSIPDVNDKGFYLLYSPQQWKTSRTTMGAKHSNTWAPEKYCTVDDNNKNNARAPPTRETIGDNSYNNHHTTTTTTTATPAIVSTTTATTPLSTVVRRLLNGRSAMVDFSFWTFQGMLYFKAYCLPVTLGIPIVSLDREYFEKTMKQQQHYSDISAAASCAASLPIQVLFDSFSARWGCIKYYMATAADVGEGRSFSMETFVRGVTNHQEHFVERDTIANTVTIVMKLKQHNRGVQQQQVQQQQQAQQQQAQQRGLEPRVNSRMDVDDDSSDPSSAAVLQPDASLVQPDIPRDDSQRWKFFFSW